MSKYCIAYNSKFGCNYKDCKDGHNKIPKHYKSRLCYYANENIIDHNLICSRGEKCKFAINIKEYLMWKYKNMTMEQYNNKLMVCNNNGTLHNLYCNENCVYSKDINEYNEWVYIYNTIFN